MLPEVQEVQLDNGLRAMLVARPTLPVVASTLWYRVGSRDERTGETGLSHFLEHMMFKGTERYAKGEIDQITGLMGGSNNAFTDNDTTGYYFSLAADRWQTALEIEASRMRGCLLDEAEFAAEKSVVLEELAMGEDDPWSSLFKATESTTFQVHPYHHPVIGYRQDLERVSVAGMREYYSRNYGPDRAFLVIVGDIDVAATEARIHALFDGIEATGRERAPVLSEPDPVGERRAVIRSPGDTTRMAVAVRTCRMGETDDFALDFLSCALAGSKSSRLYRKMVLERRLVTDVSTYNEPRLDPGGFWFTFELCQGVAPAAVEACLIDELASIAAAGLRDDEVQRARIQLESAFLFEEETALGSAMKIGRWEAQCIGGYRRLADVEALYASVDSAAVQDVVRRYFATERFNTVHSLPTEGADDVADPAQAVARG
jgi:zinc protease